MAEINCKFSFAPFVAGREFLQGILGANILYNSNFLRNLTSGSLNVLVVVLQKWNLAEKNAVEMATVYILKPTLLKGDSMVIDVYCHNQLITKLVELHVVGIRPLLIQGECHSFVFNFADTVRRELR